MPYGIQKPGFRASFRADGIHFIGPFNLFKFSVGQKQNLIRLRPTGNQISSRMIGQTFRHSAVGGHHKNIVISETSARKRDLVAIRTKDGITFVGFVNGQARSFSPCTRHGPNIPLKRKRHQRTIFIDGRLTK